MSTADASAAMLLTELVRRRIELWPHGDRLRFRPRSAMTRELAERVKSQKPALLALLRRGRPPETRPGDWREKLTSTERALIGTDAEPPADFINTVLAVRAAFDGEIVAVTAPADGPGPANAAVV